jgi:hypothetical protein
MLHWAEGNKGRNDLLFSNSDPDLALTFIIFLRNSMNVNDKDVILHVNCYTNNGLSVEQIENYWLEKLGLKRENLRKTTVVTKHPMSKGLKKGKLPYGTCRFGVHDTEKLHEIYGGIKEYAGITDDRWLF